MDIGRPQIAVLLSVLGCSYTIAMETTVVSAAIPRVISNFGGLADLSWVFSAYLVAQAITIPLFGSASDRMGRKNCYAFAAILFFTGTLACGFAWNILSLILFRALQGIGAGGLTTVGMAALNDMLPHHSRGKYQAISSAVYGLAAVSGPMIGSAIMVFLDWRYIFWINLPIVVASTASFCACYRNSQMCRRTDERPNSRDLAVGPSLYLCAGLLTLMSALVHGHAMSLWQWITCATIGLPATALLVRSQLTRTNPLIPTGLLRLRTVTVSVASAFLYGAIAMSVTVYMPSFAALVLRANYLAISATVAVMTLTWTFSAIGVGFFLSSAYYRSIAAAAGWMVLAGTAGLSWAALNANTVTPVLAMSGVLGAGLGACSVVFSVALQSAVPNEVRGSATSLFYLSRMLGQTIGVALCGGLLARADLLARVPVHTPATGPFPAVPALVGALQSTHSLRTNFLLVFSLLAALALVQLLYFWYVSATRSMDEPING